MLLLLTGAAKELEGKPVPVGKEPKLEDSGIVIVLVIVLVISVVVWIVVVKVWLFDV